MFETLHTEKDKKIRRDYIIVALTALLFIMVAIFFFGYRLGATTPRDYFSNNTQIYLKGYILNIPQEITRVADEGSNQITHLIALKNPYTKVITIGFVRNGDNDKLKDKEDGYDEDYDDSTHNEIRPTKYILK